ncbi:MAG: DUF2225 domain-containing protein [Candidatus Zixiibacteriota bacterium]
MANDSPFLLYRVECPICKTINEFETIRVGAYAEEGRDTDFCPTNVKWRFPRYQGYNPLVFFTATCSNCYYTRELTNNFRDWKDDVNFKTYRLKTVKPKHLDQLSQAESVIKTLGGHVDVSRIPNESAILKLHLSIFDEQLADHYSRLDVGRFYLRIGWVFRDLEVGEDPNRLLLNTTVYDVEEEYTKCMQSLRSAVESIKQLAAKADISTNAPELSAEQKSQLLAYRDRFSEVITDAHSQVTSGQERLSALNALVAECRQGMIGSEVSGTSRGFGRFPSFQDFLQDLKRQWNGIATNEREALERAVFYYKEAFANGRDIAPGNQQIQASYLIAELSRRIGDYDEAKQYFTSTIKSGQEFIYQNRHDKSRIALAKKILELAIEQGRSNLAAARPA